jgi:hypothetical protein
MGIVIIPVGLICSLFACVFRQCGKICSDGDSESVTVNIKVPAGAKPGDTLKLQSKTGRVVNVLVPLGANPGDTISYKIGSSSQASIVRQQPTPNTAPTAGHVMA